MDKYYATGNIPVWNGYILVGEVDVVCRACRKMAYVYMFLMRVPCEWKGLHTESLSHGLLCFLTTGSFLSHCLHLQDALWKVF
jgi:hypothetical protein